LHTQTNIIPIYTISFIEKGFIIHQTEKVLRIVTHFSSYIKESNKSFCIFSSTVIEYNFSRFIPFAKART